MYLISDSVRASAREVHDQIRSCFPVQLIAPVFPEASVLSATDLVDVAAFNARHFRNPLLGEIGCALAHLNVYSAFRGSQCPWALVLEDDVVIADVANFERRILELARNLPQDLPVIVNLNTQAATRTQFSRSYQIEGIWCPAVSTYTTSSYLLNQRAADLLRERQSPISSQADWPISSHEVLFLQESYALIAPSVLEPSRVDPEGSRASFSLKNRLQMWSGVWYARHRRHFQGFGDYWQSVLKRRIYRHIY